MCITAKIAAQWTRDAVAQEVNLITKTVQFAIENRTEPGCFLSKEMGIKIGISYKKISYISAEKANNVLKKNGFNASFTYDSSLKQFVFEVKWGVPRL